jgi:hypothetical protein
MGEISILRPRRSLISIPVGFPPNPFCAFPGNDPLSKPVLEPNLELGAKESLLFA